MDYDRVMITLNKETDKKIKELESEYQLQRGRSAVIRMAIADLHKKVLGNGNTPEPCE